MDLPIYMDHHATTPVDPRVMAAMLPFFTEIFGNAASVTHVFGWRAEAAVETARREVATAIGAEPREIVFTSGATESDNLAIKGVVAACADKGNHIVISAIEHRAVLDCARRLEREGFRVTYLPVDWGGLVDPVDVRRAITDQTILISIMTANNEIGTVQPIRAIGQIAREQGVVFHTDAAQAHGRIPINVEDDNVDLLSISAHKIYGPKGVGALYVRQRRPRIRLVPLIDGGGHERGLRSGTLPVPLIVGLGLALEIASSEMTAESQRLAALRDRLMHRIMENLEDVKVNGALSPRLPNNLNLSFAGIDGEAVLMGVKDDVALSSGSACTSAEVEPSHVLKAIGVPDGLARGSIRFGLGRSNTIEEIDYVAERIVATVTNLRRLTPHRPRIATAGP
ncbi:MAG: IscS subfamily cysteine desulfurase [candidate division Zixibacteria bacterium]|nr:IscS subfamily cysteine desulfurase [candidate division Zixibacteria bacterium]